MLSAAKLYHYKARACDPAAGRFMQTDPIGYEDDLNLYAYVGNDPMSRIDPTGTQNLALEAQRELAEIRILERCADAGCVERETAALNRRDTETALLTASALPFGGLFQALRAPSAVERDIRVGWWQSRRSTGNGQNGGG